MTTTLETYAISIESCNIAKRALYDAKATVARKDRRDRWVLDHYSAELADIETAKRDAAMAEAEYEYRHDVARFWRISCEAENAAQA